MSNYYSPPPQGPQAYPPSPYHLEPYRKPIHRSGNIIGGGLLILLVIIYGLTYLLYSVFYQFDDGSMSVIVYDLMDEAINVIAYIVAFWIPTVFITLKTGIPAKLAFPLRRPRMSICIPAIFVGLAASVLGTTISGVLSTTIESITGYAPYMSDLYVPVGVGANIVFIISIAIVPAIFEELLFRGVILQSLRRFGDGFALVVSAILFALMHGNLVQGPNALLMGLVIGYFVLRTGSLVTGILIHLINNGLVLVWLYLDWWLAGTSAEVPYLAIYGCYLLLGAAAIIFLAVKHGNLFRVPQSDYPMPPGKKYGVFFGSFAMVCYVTLSVVTMLVSFE